MELNFLVVFQRNTIKRMYIKNLPPTLCIHLKRFGYDWEANRALKFDDYFKVSLLFMVNLMIIQ